MAYNTGNPIGSGDPRDLRDNSENLDEVINGTASTWVDRLGVTRKTFKAAENAADDAEAAASNAITTLIPAEVARTENAADDAINSINTLDTQAQQALDNAEDTWETRFAADQEQRRQRFDLFLANSGYQFVGDYAADIELIEYNQVVRDASGNLWRVSASTSLPYTTTGAGLPEGGAFIAIGDADLAQNLISDPSTGQGALLVRGSVVYVDTIADLQALPVGELVDGQSAKTQEGDYVWDAAKSAWIEAPVVDVPLRRETEWLRAGRLKDQLEALAPTLNPSTKLRFNKRSADEFEVSIPWWKPGQYLAHRFNKNDAAFGDSLTTLNRPFRQSLIRPDKLISRNNFDLKNYRVFSNSTIGESGVWQVVSGMGNYIEFSIKSMKELTINVLKRPSAPIVRVTLNGQDDLADQITLTEGKALIDLYASSNTDTDIPIATDIPQGTDYKVRIEIVDQNEDSTGALVYVRSDAGLRTRKFYDGFEPVLTESSLSAIKQFTSATEYAIGFRPESDANASSPFIGSSHGYEEIVSRELYFDDELIDYDSLPDGHWAAPETISLVQKTAIKHPDYLSTTYAEVTHTHRLNKDGLQQSYNWKWTQDVNVRNGYTQMFTFGGSVSALSSDFARRAIFRGQDTSRLLLADNSGAAIRALTDEVVVTGDPDVTTTTADRPYARGIACLVSIGDLEQSMEGFENDLAYEDAAWVNDRSSFRKLYLQPFRQAGLRQEGSAFRGKMAVKYYIAPELCESLV